MSVFDLIFPKKCVVCRKVGGYLCFGCSSSLEPLFPQVCAVCEHAALDGLTHIRCTSSTSPQGLYSVWKYNLTSKRLIQRLKYKFVREIAEVLVSLLKCSLKHHLRHTKHSLDWSSPAITIVPIPLYWTKQNWRGFNQAAIVAKLLCGEMGWNYEEILIRTRSTDAQVGKTEEERQKNIKGVFKVVKNSLQVDNQIVLFDDVWTTGATLKEAVREVKKAGLKNVWCLTLAR